MNILVTGAAGFIGKNLVQVLTREGNHQVSEYDRNSGEADLRKALSVADLVYHLAGENRPPDPRQYEETNVGLTVRIVECLTELRRKPRIVFASSIQAEQENPYGTSKRRAEDELRRFAEITGAPVVVYRLKNTFGKWSRPNYNSVVATFCHNVARDLPISVNDPGRVLDLVYIDDVVSAFLGEITRLVAPRFAYAEVPASYQIALRELAETIQAFRRMRASRMMPDFSDRLVRCLYATYLSHLETSDFAYDLEIKADSRGQLAEFLKAHHFGQVFVSTTKPGVTRGNHFHHTKTEKFLVVQGDAEIRFRHIVTGEIIRYRVTGSAFRVVDIPPGYTHAIENIGETDLIVLFWASEVFDPTQTDTYVLEVEHEEA